MGIINILSMTNRACAVSDISEKIITNFGQIFPAHVEALCELLIVLRRQFLGDLDLMLILAIIGSRALPARLASNMTYSEFIGDDNKERADQPINIQSIAECSGIPRETVRRKVHKLQDLGFIERDAKGMLTVTPQAMEQLTPATEASLRYLITLSESSDAIKRAETD